MLRSLAILVIVAAVSLPGGASALGVDSLFASANNHFEQKEYDLALDEYVEVAGMGYESAALHFNIGNCHFKQGQLGYAILYYLRAKRLNPNDDDINANLAFARQFMPTRLEGVKVNPVTEFMKMVVSPFTLEKIAWISSVLFVVFFLFLSAMIYFRLQGFGSKLLVYVLLILMLVGLGMTTYKYRIEYLTKTGVIVSEEARVFSAPSVDSDVEFVGAFGLTFEVGKKVDDYYLVIFENKRKGWIRKDDIEII
ncbi:MAG: tetratricopeptide repeat protein [Candidatus Zixiibacteriota bacterium]|nr:MAG: tetratricopeptide repeat protein [candidate division Zixibacteria bacterium]